MAQQIPSRTQRRMEKKQALVLLVLIVAVALASFALGVMVGRGSRSAPEQVAAAPTHLPIKAPGVTSSEAPAAAAGQPVEKPAQATPSEPATPSAAAPPKKAASASAGNHLTFYDTLPKGQQPPLGSGINLPPGSAEKPAPAPAVKAEAPTSPPPAKTVKQAETPRTAAKASSSSKPVAAPRAVAHGAYVVQVASFKNSADAEVLRKRLDGRHYPAFAQAADLGAKGVWHRVLVGPFATVSDARQVAGRLRTEEHLSALVKKR
ncbi:MAG TPA: SPOR domain-containing protein [Desulfuromonadales bacterium]|nr:SPOR domain-containing protein [Desulfuromonadales bacterium]